MAAVLVLAVLFLLFVVLYTGYSKVEKRLVLGNIPRSATLAELNKLCALVGITGLGLSSFDSALVRCF